MRFDAFPGADVSDARHGLIGQRDIQILGPEEKEGSRFVIDGFESLLETLEAGAKVLVRCCQMTVSQDALARHSDKIISLNGCHIIGHGAA